MKSAVLFLGLIAITQFLNAQYQVEWTCNVGNGQLNSLNVFQDGIYYSSRDNFGKLNYSGKSQFLKGSENTWITNLQNYKNQLFVAGDPRSTLCTANGISIKNQDFLWPDNSSLAIVKTYLLNDNYYLATSNAVRKYSTSGKMIWVTEIAKNAMNQQLRLSDNHLYLYSVVHNSSEGGILKYDTLGNRIWRDDPGMIVSNIVTDELGSCYLLGSGIEAPFGVRKLDKDGQQVWWQTYPDLVIRNGYVLGDSLYVCGYDLTNKKAMYLVLSAQNGDMIEKTLLYDNALGHLGDFTHIYPTYNAVYVGGIFGQGPPLQAFIAKFSDPRFVSVKEQVKDNNHIQVFPNPAREEINVQLLKTTSDQIALTLLDQLGRVVASEKYYVSLFDSDSMQLKAPGAKGVYILRVNDGTKVYTEKVVFD